MGAGSGQVSCPPAFKQACESAPQALAFIVAVSYLSRVSIAELLCNAAINVRHDSFYQALQGVILVGRCDAIPCHAMPCSS